MGSERIGEGVSVAVDGLLLDRMTAGRGRESEDAGDGVLCELVLIGAFVVSTRAAWAARAALRIASWVSIEELRDGACKGGGISLWSDLCTGPGASEGSLYVAASG